MAEIWPSLETDIGLRPLTLQRKKADTISRIASNARSVLRNRRRSFAVLMFGLLARSWTIPMSQNGQIRAGSAKRGRGANLHCSDIEDHGE